MSPIASTSALEVPGNNTSDEIVQRRSQRNLDRNGSANSSTNSVRQQQQHHHHHLGLRPKASDSLHTLLRTSNPRPKHVSKIEDITSSSILNAGLGMKREESEDSRISGEGKNYISSTSSEADASVYDQRRLEKEQEESDHIEATTDIGLYDESVYDQYLGSLMGSLRRKLIKSLEWESPLIARHQASIRSPRLDRYFVYTSLLGTHSFFLIFLPMAFWIGNARFGRGLINVLAFGVYLSSAIKDALCIPRPFSPPVTRLVVGTTHLEYGFVSTHSTNSISIAIYMYLWLRAMRAEDLVPAYVHSGICEVALLFYVVSVVYGRIYCGMHSVMDCLMGCLLGAFVSLIQWYCFDIIEDLTLSGGWSVPIVVISVGLFMVVVHPQPLDDCPCFEDSIAFLSVVMGIVTARWTNVRYGLLPKDDNPLVNYNNVYNKVIKPITKTIKIDVLKIPEETFQSRVIGLLFTILVMTSKLIFGVLTILIARLTVKTICRIILPPIFRFLQRTIGLVVPRRHYGQTTQGTSPRKDIDVNAKRPSHKRQSSSAGGEFFSNQSDPTQYDSIHWKADTRSSTQQAQDRAQMETYNRPARSERNKVKFTLGDYSNIPVPFTHPNTHLPGDAFSERVAGAISSDEKQRQRQESERKYQFPMRQVDGEEVGGSIEEEEESAHYDIDVLTKVFVYHAIGFVTSCCLPAFFLRYNW